MKGLFPTPASILKDPAFKEELKAIQEERDERNKYKALLKAGGAPIPGKSVVDIPPGKSTRVQSESVFSKPVLQAATSLT